MVRTTAKALIVDKTRKRILAIRNVEDEETFHTLPGGGQEAGENLGATLKRECLEELGLVVRPLHVAFLRDYIGKNHDFAYKHEDVHALDIVFECEVDPGATPSVGPKPDTNQVGVVWLPIDELLENDFYPRCFIGAIHRHLESPSMGASYLGDTN